MEHTMTTKPAYARSYNRIFKRLMDILFSLSALFLVWPVMVICAIAVVIDDGFPVFYRADRTGYHGSTFRICKFRTMIRNADRIGGGTTALHDPRITAVGRFLRSTKLDELPQLWQVLTGHMSLVGPRPELPRYTERYYGPELDILKVRPGITDYSSLEFISLDQIVGCEDADRVYETLVLHRKNQLRIRYAHSVSFGTDMKILLHTVSAVLQKCMHTIAERPHGMKRQWNL